MPPEFSEEPQDSPTTPERALPYGRRTFTSMWIYRNGDRCGIFTRQPRHQLMMECPIKYSQKDTESLGGLPQAVTGGYEN